MQRLSPRWRGPPIYVQFKDIDRVNSSLRPCGPSLRHRDECQGLMQEGPAERQLLLSLVPWQNEAMAKAELHPMVDRLPDQAVDGAAILLGGMTDGGSILSRLGSGPASGSSASARRTTTSPWPGEALRERRAVPGGVGRAHQATRCRRMRSSRPSGATGI